MEIEKYKDQEDIKRNIKTCEGKHVQQVAYSSYHDALTQVCFGCNKVRTNLKMQKYQNEELQSCYDKGIDSIKNGANQNNSNYSIFNTEEKMKAWGHGRADAKVIKDKVKK